MGLHRNLLFVFGLMLLLSTELCALAAESIDPTPSSQNIAKQFSEFVWYGTGPDEKSGIMLVASISGRFESIKLTMNRLETEGCRYNQMVFEANGPAVFSLVGLNVYRDPKGKCLYAAVRYSGAGTVADWVVRIDNHYKTLYDNMNRGNPIFRLQDGNQEIREVWYIPHLMDQVKDWHPSKDYDGHVLVERIYRLNSKDEFELKSTYPAIEDERQLSKKDYQLLQAGREDYESRHQKPEVQIF